MRINKSVLLLLLFSLYLYSNALRVDINYLSAGRKDMFTPRWNNWAPASATTITSSWDDIQVTFRNAGKTGTGIRDGWYKGMLTYGATLTVDGITIEDASSGGIMEMVISGLSPGTHSLVTWHSFYDNVSGSTMEIAVNNEVKYTGLKVPKRVRDDFKALRAFMSFDVENDQDVIVRFKAEGNGNFDNVVINAFEIDATDPAKSISSTSPSEGDDHYPEEKGLQWTGAEGTASYDVYIGIDSSSVEQATNESIEYKGNQTNATYTLDNYSPLETYWWRIDERFPDNAVVKGMVIPFRIRRIAFPTAEGYGKYARGGRGGRVIEVTSLADNGPGTLRDALENEKGPRAVVFRIGGVIPLDSRLVIPSDGGDVYVAGQTAPGDGICITRYAFGMLSDDVIIRHVRTRVGDYCKQSMDGMGMSSSDNCIIDHCSISWSIDEGHSSRGAKNITFQHNIISEALNNSYHYDADDRSKTERHSFAASIGGHYGSYFFNLHAHCTGRNWSLAGGLEQDAKTYAGYVEIINNVVYNWRDRTTDGGVRQCNFVNNYYKAGPSSTLMQLASIDGDELHTGDMQRAYIKGNKMISANGQTILNPSSDNWSRCMSKYSTVNQVKSNSPLFPISITPKSADDAYTEVLSNVGATKPLSDNIDTRIIKEVKNGTYTFSGSKDRLKGIIDSQKDVGGYPSLKSGKSPDDSDHDGMPDEWENAHGLDPANADDRNDISLSDNYYTNLEMYLNELAGDHVVFKTTASRAGNRSRNTPWYTIQKNNITVHASIGSRIHINVIDISGKCVATLFDETIQTEHETIPFNSKALFAKGMYILHVTKNNNTQAQKIVHLNRIGH